MSEDDAAEHVLCAGFLALFKNENVQPSLRHSVGSGYPSGPCPDDYRVELLCHVADSAKPAFFNSSINAGTILNRSPTTPKFAILKIAASGSRLIATMSSAFMILTMC